MNDLLLSGPRLLRPAILLAALLTVAILLALTAPTGSAHAADFGGKEILGDNLIESSGTAKGTFKGTDILTGAEFSGSWNCHGVIWHGP
jgi:hypothetical protein